MLSEAVSSAQRCSGGVTAADAVSTIDLVVGLNRETFDLWIDDLALLCRGVCRAPPF